MTRDARIYLAGLFDGEGCFSSYRAWSVERGLGSRRRWRIFYKAAITMTEGDVVRWVHRTLGFGLFYNYHTKKNRARGYKRRFTYHANGPQAARLARLILPFLKAKKRRAQLIIELSELRGKSSNVAFRPKRQLAISRAISRLNWGKGQPRKRTAGYFPEGGKS